MGCNLRKRKSAACKALNSCTRQPSISLAVCLELAIVAAPVDGFVCGEGGANWASLHEPIEGAKLRPLAKQSLHLPTELPKSRAKVQASCAISIRIKALERRDK